MITINLAQNQADAIALLEAYQGGDFSYKFEGKQGIRMKFSVTGDPEQAGKKAKDLIKSQQWGTNLYFNVMIG
ncbi:MAG: hypothetical protein FWE25_00265 [Lachnospiraceae bacterium]|nr:hypothetical protein [Lachnospiraceae bacterium]